MNSLPSKEKVWGWSYPLLLTEDIEIVKIEVRHGGYSSRHAHKNKANMFFVLSGVLQVITYLKNTEDYDQIRFLHREGDAFQVAAGIFHRFRALAPTVAIEVYRPTGTGKLDPNDIIRSDEGGLLDLSNLS
jgi:quercetin dioxygenase-like cupin family protein